MISIGQKTKMPVDSMCVRAYIWRMGDCETGSREAIKMDAATLAACLRDTLDSLSLNTNAGRAKGRVVAGILTGIQAGYLSRGTIVLSEALELIFLAEAKCDHHSASIPVVASMIECVHATGLANADADLFSIRIDPANLDCCALMLDLARGRPLSMDFEI